MIAKATRIFGHGVDIAKISRFSQTYQKYGERYLKKALHPNEITQFHNIVDINEGKARFLASRWALKEAVIKASGKRLLFPDIFLYADKSIDPRPRLALEGEALAYFQQLRLDAVVSVSHDGDYAMASVILQQEVE